MVSPTTPGQSVRRFAAGNATAAVVDQLAFGLQTFAIALAGLHWLSLEPLGQLTLASTLVILFQVAYRSFALEPLLIRFTTAPEGARRRAVEHAAGLSVAVSVGLVLAFALCGLATREPLMPAAALAAGLLILQDGWRTGLFAGNRFWAVAANDCLCTAVTLGGLGWLAFQGAVDPSELLLVWAAGAAAGTVLGAVQLRAIPAVRCAASWARTQRDLGLPLTGSILAQQMAGRVSLLVIAGVGGASALGALSAARIVLSPVNTLIMAAFAFAMPEARRRLDASVEDLRAFTRRVGGTLALATTIAAAALYFAPDTAGELLAGQNWTEAQGLLLPTALWVFGTAASEGARIGLRALEDGRTLFRVAMVLGLFMLAATTVGMVTFGVTGAAWAFAVSSVLGQLAWTWAYRRAER